MSRLRYAGVTGTIGSGNLTNSATSHTFTAPLTYANGVTVPTLVAPDYFLLSILNAGALSEIVKVTAYDSSTGAATIVRAQEGTSGVSATSGAAVTLAAYPSDLSKGILVSSGAGQLPIDEFRGETLDSAYVQVDKSGGSGRATWTKAGDSLYLLLAGGDSAAESHAQVKPLSPYGGAMVTTDAIIGHVNVGQPATGNFTMAGLILADGTSNASGKQVLSFVYPGWGVAEDTTNYSVAGTLNQSGISTLPRITESFWVRLVKTGTSTWRTDHSYNGIHWVTGPTATQSFTPTHVGVFGSSWGGAVVGHVSFDCIRRVTGVA